jgi:hypothetical protein
MGNILHYKIGFCYTLVSDRVAIPFCRVNAIDLIVTVANFILVCDNKTALFFSPSSLSSPFLFLFLFSNFCILLNNFKL